MIIEQRFSSLKTYQTDKIAAAKDEGIVFVQVPEEFTATGNISPGVMTHIYLETRPSMIAAEGPAIGGRSPKAGCAVDGYFLLLGSDRDAGAGCY